MMAGPSGHPVETRLHGRLPLMEATAAAASVEDDDTLLVSGFGSVGDPKLVPEALADAGRALDLTVISGGSVGPPIDEALVEAGGIARRYPFQATEAARTAINEGRMAFDDRHVGGLADEVRYGGLAEEATAVVEAVAVGPDWLVPSTSIGQTPAFLEAADRVIVEVNRAQPLALQRFHDIYRQDAPPSREPIPLSRPDDRIGTPWVSFDPESLVAVVETDRPDQTYTFRDPTETDRRIADHTGEWLDEERNRSPILERAVTVQCGVGSLGNAMMGALGRIGGSTPSVGYFGEVIQDGLLEALSAGDVAFASATSLALSRDGQEQVFDDPAAFADDIVLRPTEISNHPALVDRFGVVAINSAIEVDLAGNVNSTYVNGRSLLHGIGGSGDFNRPALVTVCAFPSTARDGAVSRLVPMTLHVDHTAHDVDVFVTEHGFADVRACSPLERAERLIDACAHPRYRARLRSYLATAREQEGQLPLDAEAARAWMD